MTFEEFQNLARLHVVDGLDPAEEQAFATARRAFGSEAEDYIRECVNLNAAFALSLRPAPPKEDAKHRLMKMIGKSNGSASQRVDGEGQDHPLSRFSGHFRRPAG